MLQVPRASGPLGWHRQISKTFKRRDTISSPTAKENGSTHDPFPQELRLAVRVFFRAVPDLRKQAEGIRSRDRRYDRGLPAL
jgi:hypothetical protein